MMLNFVDYVFLELVRRIVKTSQSTLAMGWWVGRNDATQELKRYYMQNKKKKRQNTI